MFVYQQRTISVLFISQAAQYWQTYLEMLYVNYVKSNNGCEQPDIGLSYFFSKIEGSLLSLGKVLFYTIQRFEKRGHCLLVRFLCGSKTRLVDTIVDIVVCPIIGSLYFRL